ncbi:unnamed protein product [Cercopithifilaria johnstoni]|uniref:Uncharacterized protein n=1 Tax=Cercopithifilaria johnstoni TaxID=2874296 RepID=A0A8J2LMV1_9BILA|nr:unnamed protein product [Cercopithifilaria johnstoni]
MAMAPEVSIDKTFIAPETPKYQRRKYHKIKDEQGQLSKQQQYLQLPQQSSSSYDYCHYYQDNSDDDHQNASPSKQQSTLPSSITLLSPKLTFRESLRESFRDLYVPKFLSNLRKSASEISLVLEAVRSGPIPTYLETHEVPPPSPCTKGTVAVDSASKLIRGSSTMKKRKRRNALVTWQNYSPHHLNDQLRHGN